MCGYRCTALLASSLVLIVACSNPDLPTSATPEQDASLASAWRGSTLGAEVGATATCPGGFPSDLVNGSFELPVMGSSFYLVDPSLTSWSTTDSHVEIWGTSMVAPYEGLQSIELNAFLRYGNVWQDLCIPAGTPLSFSFAHRGRETTEALEVSFIDLGINGTFDDDDLVLYSGRFEADPSEWVLNEVTTGASSNGTPIRMRFLTVEPVRSASFGNLIDAVVLNGGASPPPPPLDPGPLSGPAQSGDALNTVRGGQTVPLKFRFLDASRAVVTDTDAVNLTVTDIACSGAVPLGEDLRTSSRNNTKPGLRYNTDDQAFMYHWTSPKERGGCVMLEASLKDEASSVAKANGNYAAWRFMIR